MKLPAFQFYPADWKKDPGVQALSFHDRGVWFEILCLMHESEQRGKLLLGGQPMPDSALARLLGLDKQNLTNTLTTLLTYGVASRDPESGALICRRMVRDEEIRNVRKKCGKLGGNPNLVNQTSNQTPTTQVKQKSTPSSSSSITSSEEDCAAGILPKGWKKMTTTEKKRKKVNSNTAEMIRIGSWFKQRPETLWTISEYLALQDVEPTEEDLKLIEEHYSYEIEKNGFRFTAIETLLNNWSTARAKANAFFQENPTLGI